MKKAKNRFVFWIVKGGQLIDDKIDKPYHALCMKYEKGKVLTKDLDSAADTDLYNECCTIQNEFIDELNLNGHDLYNCDIAFEEFANEYFNKNI